jgi:hypothetical protein
MVIGPTVQPVANTFNCGTFGNGFRCLGETPDGTATQIDFAVNGAVACGTQGIVTLDFFEDRNSGAPYDVDNHIVQQIAIPGPACPPPPPPAPQTGCIAIVKQALDPLGNPIIPLETFTFLLDGKSSTQIQGSGTSSLQNIPVGQHTVTEVLPTGWKLFHVSPVDGKVDVRPGSPCAVVTFTNQEKLQQCRRHAHRPRRGSNDCRW